MIDDGETDWKVICINAEDPLASQLNDIDDVERVLPGYIPVIREWLVRRRAETQRCSHCPQCHQMAAARDWLVVTM